MNVPNVTMSTCCRFSDIYVSRDWLKSLLGTHQSSLRPEFCKIKFFAWSLGHFCGPRVRSKARKRIINEFTHNRQSKNWTQLYFFNQWNVLKCTSEANANATYVWCNLLEKFWNSSAVVCFEISVELILLTH